MISAIVLGAGESKRMGAQNKLLLPFGEKTLIETIVENVVASVVSEVIVVLGHEAEQVQAVLQHYPVQLVLNTNYQAGMTTSIQAGVRAVSSETDGIMVCLSDLPYVQTEDFNTLMQSFEVAKATNERQIVLPTFQGQRGNPVIFSVDYKSQILNQQGINGCRGVIQQNPDQVRKVEMPTSHVLIDIDTKEDYKNVLQN